VKPAVNAVERRRLALRRSGLVTGSDLEVILKVDGEL
jgi:hypothetical protein